MAADDMILFKIQICLVAVLEGVVVPVVPDGSGLPCFLLAPVNP